jgi:general secretion pathway protein G
MEKSCAGFTLIELMVVMAIIGLLLSLSVPRYFHHVDRAKESVLRQNLAQIRDAIDKYFADNDRYPDSLEVLQHKKYLRKVPLDPVTGQINTWIIIGPDKKELGELFDVKSGAQGRSSDGSAYDSW